MKPISILNDVLAPTMRDHSTSQAAEDAPPTTRARPLIHVKRAEPPFVSATEMAQLCKKRDLSAGDLGAWYEAEMLGITEEEVIAETVRRFEIMFASVEEGLRGKTYMQSLSSSAHKIMAADRADRLPTGGLHTRAAARAMAALQVNDSTDDICSVPIAGVLPGVTATMLLEQQVSKRTIADALLAAGLIGTIVAHRLPVSEAEADCQIRIGAAGAMAAAAIVESVGGTVQQTTDAAAVSLQNASGAICNRIRQTIEISCHTRTAVAASSAFVVADLIIGGYENPIPLDQTLDTITPVNKRPLTP